METNVPPPNDPPPNRPWLGRRKQIASREVILTAGDVELEMQAAARGLLTPADVIDVPSLPNRPPDESILDPTLFSVRQRRTGQNVAYRFTQFIIVAAFIVSCAAIVNSLLGHRHRALASAGLGCIISAVAVKLVQASRLAYRLRGYVAAVGILSAIALALSLMPPLFHAETPSTPPDKKPAATNPLE